MYPNFKPAPDAARVESTQQVKPGYLQEEQR